MNENGCAVLGQPYVGFSGDVLRMESVPKSQTMQSKPDLQLRLRILALDARHHPGASCGIDDVSHGVEDTASPAAWCRHAMDGGI